ncbi:MAG: ribonuclease HI family protein [Candidatus Omnitrophica bacterium]|nr:ribonuclease HI family protein [Candidatus Omnitrophota bacterium]
MKPTQNCEIYIDGASRGNPGPSGVGVVLQAGRAAPAHHFSKFIGHTTNNVAEYLALIYALQEALQAGYTELTVKTDSELLARQVNGQYHVRDPQLRLLYDLALHLVNGFRRCEVRHIPRAENAAADRLAGQAVKHASPH